MESPERKRVVELEWEEGYGSGYLVAPGVVLTARHVLEAKGKPPPKVGFVCRVRAVGENRKKRPEWDGAKLMWIGEGEHDVAVLHTDTRDRIHEMPRLGKLPDNAAAIECRAIGFPKATKTPAGDDIYQLDGIIRTNTFWLSADHSVDVVSTPPTDPKSWSGISGAALFAGEFLVGVIKTYPPEFSGKMIKAVLLDVLANDSDFCTALGQSHPLPLDKVRETESTAVPSVPIRNLIVYQEPTREQIQAISEVVRSNLPVPKDDTWIGEIGSGRQASDRALVSVGRMPAQSGLCVCRDAYLAKLDLVYNRGAPVIQVVGPGGEGKSTLVSYWIKQLIQSQSYYGQHIYAWSFYRQGFMDRLISAGDFFDDAIRFFKATAPVLSSECAKVQVLIEIIRNQRVILIIDGLETLQFPPGSLEGPEGRLKDPLLRFFFSEINNKLSQGTCIVTSRIVNPDLGRETLIKLHPLTPPEGATLLRILGIKGSDSSLERLSDQFQGHCLALSLIGSYLKRACSGHIPPDISSLSVMPDLNSQRQ